MQHATPSNREYRRTRRRHVSDRLQRKYDYRGVKRAMGFALIAAFAVYLSAPVLASLVSIMIN